MSRTCLSWRISFSLPNFDFDLHYLKMRKMQNIIFLMGVLLPLCVGSSVSPTLQLVNLVYRHGDRSPIVVYPLDKHNFNNTPAWSQGPGWLSMQGMRQHFAAGAFLRRRYNGFLSSKYVSQEIQIESSALQRCLMSAYSNLAGLYPPGPDQTWNPDIPWQPIPVTMVPDTQDDKLSLDENCPKYNQLYAQVLKSDVVKQEEKRNREFYKFVSKHTGIPHENISDIWQVGDTLFCEKAQNLTWNSWVNETVFQKLHSLVSFGFSLMYHTQEMARLKGGPLLKQFIDNMNGKINGSLDARAKMFMYSAHDTTVAAFLSALHLYNKLSPPYTATVIMELHKENGKYNVQLFYRNFTTTNVNDTKEPLPLTLNGCQFKCPIERFLTLTKTLYPTNWLEECQTDNNLIQLNFNAATIIAVCIGIAITAALVVVIIVMCVRHRRRRTHRLFTKFDG